MYLVPSGVAEKELLLKKSRFIARAGKVTNKNDAKAFLHQMQLDFPDANHHCWAYLVGNPANAMSAAMSDDGEPSGTAGKPILNVLQHKMVGDVMVVVARYFGGIKLGAGGLVRAYSSAAQLVMEGMQTSEHRVLSSVSIQCNFASESLLRHWLGTVDGVLKNLVYGEGVQGEILIAKEHVSTLNEMAASHGWKIKETDAQ